MKEMGLDINEVQGWFVEEDKGNYTLIKLNKQQAASLVIQLPVPLRRSYASDIFLKNCADEHNVTVKEILATLLPPAGSTMAGDFGEILVYCYQGSLLAPSELIGYKKWRLKQDRTKPAPYSDVIHVFLPAWPQTSVDDRILCSEVKVKSTNGASHPIPEAINDSQKDQTSRLAKTLVWLRERALTQSSGAIDIAQLSRFLNGIELGPVIKEFRAVAVIDADFLDTELATIPTTPFAHCSLLVISLPDLKQTYSDTFAASAAILTI